MASQLHTDYWNGQSQEMEQFSTVVKESFSFVWTINNFGEFMDRKYEFSSSTFSRNLSSGTSEWKMVVFPRSTYPEGTHVALRLSKISEDNKSYSVIYTISLVDIYSDLHEMSTGEKVFRDCMDFDECLVTSNRNINKKCLLRNGTLTINCKIDLLVCENQDDSDCKSYKDDSISKLYNDKDDSISKSYENLDCMNYKSFENPDRMIYKSQQSEEKMKISTLTQSVNDLSSSISYKSSEGSEKDINTLLEKHSNLLQEITKNPKQPSYGYDGTNFKTDLSLEILSNDLKQLYYTTDQQDVTICVDDGKRHAHKLILTSRSDYFKQAFSMQYGNLITIPGINTVTLDAILYYLYSGKLPQFTDQDAVGLLKACKFLNLPQLGLMMQNILKSQITVSNVTDVYRISKEMKFDSLKNSALKFVAENHEEVSLSPQWNSLMRNDPHSAGEVLLTVAAFQNKLTNNEY